MGRFVLYKGNLRPSDSYLATHSLPDYDPEDWYNDAYDVEDDEEVLYEQRICSDCHAPFTLYDAMSICTSSVDWPSYLDEFAGEYCGDCAADRLRKMFSE